MKTHHLKFRMAKDDVSKIKSKAMNTFLGDCTLGKNPTDQEVISLIKIYLNNIDKTEKMAGVTEVTKIEREMFMEYMPQSISEDDIKRLLARSPQVSLRMSDIGKIMALCKDEAKHLNKLFDGNVVKKVIADAQQKV